jgi:hypothetical protein
VGEDLVGWRVERLRAAGLDDALARAIAADGRYDLHALLELVDRGCPAPLAARILAPLEDAERG